MRSILFLLILFPSCFFSQNRDRRVTALNEIVELMNRSGRLNREYYNRSTEFCGNLCGNYKPEEWVSVVVGKKSLLSHFARNDSASAYALMKKKLKELKPDERLQIYTYESDALPYLLQREKLKTIIAEDKTILSQTVKENYLKFIIVADELVMSHYEMRIYTQKKQQFKDPGFKTARSISRRFNEVLDKYLVSANQLWDCIEKDYMQNFPPSKIQQPIVEAEKELMASLKLVYAWAGDKFINAEGKDSLHIKAILANSSKAMERESLYFQNTFGYQDTDPQHQAYYSSYIATPSGLYKNFYNTLNTLATKNVSSTNLDFNKSDPSKRGYNYKVIHFNTAVEAYNNFVTWADGKAVLSILKRYYEKEEVNIDGLDTSTNVLLKRPYLPSYFNCLCVSEKSLAAVAQKDSAGTQDILHPVPDSSAAGSRTYDSLLIDNALPHHLVYLLDASSSMNEAGRLAVLKTNAKYLVSLQRKEDRISIVSFASLAHVIMHNKPCDKKTEIHHRIDRIEAQGSSNIDAGILKAFEIADSCKIAGGKTKLLLITDGLFKLSRESLKLIKSLSKHDIGFCIIYIGNSQNQRMEEQFKKICEQAKGRFYNTKTTGLKDILVKEASG